MHAERRGGLLLWAGLCAGLAGCRHVPPDPAQRAARPPPPPARIPAAKELLGAWRSVVLRGTLAELGDGCVYVFLPDGRLRGAFVSGEDCVPFEGRYTYRAGTLVLEGGALRLTARMRGEQLELRSETDYLVLVPFGR